MNDSAQTGRSGKPCCLRLVRPCTTSQITPAAMMAATIQLPVAPMAPYGPPPSSAKVASTGEIVRPSAARNATPRQTSNPPSVTMKDGIDR